jgi:hypothetical protein
MGDEQAADTFTRDPDLVVGSCGRAVKRARWAMAPTTVVATGRGNLDVQRDRMAG